MDVLQTDVLKISKRSSKRIWKSGIGPTTE